MKIPTDRQIRYQIGKYLQWLGSVLERPGNRLYSFGQNLWDANCDCEMCQKRAKKERDDERD